MSIQHFAFCEATDGGLQIFQSLVINVISLIIFIINCMKYLCALEASSSAGPGRS